MLYHCFNLSYAVKDEGADYATIDQMLSKQQLPIWQYSITGHFEGGDFAIVEPGKG